MLKGTTGAIAQWSFYAEYMGRQVYGLKVATYETIYDVRASAVGTWSARAAATLQAEGDSIFSTNIFNYSKKYNFDYLIRSIN